MQKNKLSNIFNIKMFFFIFMTISGLVIAFNMPRFSLPLLIAYIMSLILRPIVPGIEKIGIGKTPAIMILFVIVGFFLVYPVVKVTPILKTESDNFQYYLPKIETFIKSQYTNLKVKLNDKIGIDLEDNLIDDGLEYVKTGTKSTLLKIPKFLASFLEWSLIIPLFLFFILKDGMRFKFSYLSIVPNSIFERVYYLFHQFNKRIGDYIFAKFIEASIVGILITVGLLIIDVRFALLLGLVAAISNIIPYIGPMLGSIPGLIICFLNHKFGPVFYAVSTLYLIANIIDLAFVFPILVSKIVDIHPVLVVISVILGSQYFGVLGMIISIPLAAICKLVVQEFYREIYGIHLSNDP